ncbi:hypothetical protein Pen01_20170 [Phytomonospora endophytica]|nr:hypothetical protein Pen01_20170 [Phytomonospora endophytica]
MHSGVGGFGGVGGAGVRQTTGRPPPLTPPGSANRRGHELEPGLGAVRRIVSTRTSGGDTVGLPVPAGRHERSGVTFPHGLPQWPGRRHHGARSRRGGMGVPASPSRTASRSGPGGDITVLGPGGAARAFRRVISLRASGNSPGHHTSRGTRVPERAAGGKPPTHKENPGRQATGVSRT